MSSRKAGFASRMGVGTYLQFALVASLTCGTAGAQDPYEYKSYGTQPFAVTDRTLSVRGRMDDDAFKSFRKKKITDVETSGIADAKLFEGRKRFPQLRRVSLGSNSNGDHLKALSERYSRIRTLALNEDRRITDQDIALLKKFRKLDELQVRGAIPDVKLFLNSLPRSVKHLSLSQTGAPTSSPRKFSVPNVVELRLDSENVPPGFLSSLNAPRLRKLHLSHCALRSGTLERLSRLGQIKELALSGTVYSRQELEKLQDSAPRLTIALE